MRAAVAIAVLIATACGPSPKSTTPPPGASGTDAGAASVTDAGATAEPAPSADASAAAAPANEHERCSRLVGHMLDVAIGELPEADRPRARAVIAGDRDRLVEECTAGDLTEPEYTCAMAAQSSADMEKCGR